MSKETETMVLLESLDGAERLRVIRWAMERWDLRKREVNTATPIDPYIQRIMADGEWLGAGEIAADAILHGWRAPHKTTVTRQLAQLVANGTLEAKGDRRARKYRLLPS